MIRMKLIVLLVFEVLGMVAIARAQCAPVQEAAIPGHPRLPHGGHASGEVRIEVTVAPSGEVVEARVLSGPERLLIVSERAARKWRFGALPSAVKCHLTFAFMVRPALGDPPAIQSVFKAPDRIEIFGEKREIVTISDPLVEDVEKTRKKKRK